jgi:hypothetical protein
MPNTIQSVVIAEDESLSTAVRLGGDIPVELIMPAAWTAAALTFQTSSDGVTYQDLYTDAAAEVTVQAAAARNIKLNPETFTGINYLKIRSGTSGTPVAQAAARTIQISVWAI